MNLHKISWVLQTFHTMVYILIMSEWRCHLITHSLFDHSWFCKANISSQIKNIENNNEMYLICCNEEDCLNTNRSWVEWTIVINILDSLSKEETYMLLWTHISAQEKKIYCIWAKKWKRLHSDSPRKPICSHCTKCRNY